MINTVTWELCCIQSEFPITMNLHDFLLFVRYLHQKCSFVMRIVTTVHKQLTCSADGFLAFLKIFIWIPVFKLIESLYWSSQSTSEMSMRHVRVFVKSRSANMTNIRQRQEVKGRESTSVLQNGHKDEPKISLTDNISIIYSVIVN